MPTTPDPVTTVINILSSNWASGTGGVQPTTTDMVDGKVRSTSDGERFIVYTRRSTYTVDGLPRQNYSRVDPVSILWQSAGDRKSVV